MSHPLHARFAVRLTAVALNLALFSCTAKTTAEPPLPPVTDVPSASGASPALATISATIVPVRQATLSAYLQAPVGSISVAAGDRVADGQPLIMLDVPELEFRVVQAEAALSSARTYAELQRYSNRVLNDKGKFIYTAGPPELRRVADARVLEAEAALLVAQGELSQATLRAPFDGTVVQVPARVGEVVSLADPLITIADLQAFEIETTDLSEREAAALHVGDGASAYVEALGNSFPVTVRLISPFGRRDSGDVFYQTLLTFDEQPPGLRWGMSVELTFPPG